jgi:hypothetical protein
MAYEKLFQWEVVEISEEASRLYDMERSLLEHAYKTRIETLETLMAEVDEMKRVVLPADLYKDTPAENVKLHCLLVPSKDARVVKALLTGEVKDIIDVPKDKYYVFRNDLSTKREKKSWQRYSGSRKHFRTRYYMYMGILIIILLTFFKYMPR